MRLTRAQLGSWTNSSEIIYREEKRSGVKCESRGRTFPFKEKKKRIQQKNLDLNSFSLLDV